MQDSRRSPLVVASKSPICSPVLGPIDEPLQAVPIDEVKFELLEEPATGDSASPMCEGVDRRSGEDGLSGEMIAQANANLGRDEPAYIVPTTPSPFLHSSFPPQVVPPFSYGSGLYDLGLPPAYGTDCEVLGGLDGYAEADGQYMQGLGFLPADMFETSYGCGGWPGTWGVPVDNTAGQDSGASYLTGGGDRQDTTGMVLEPDNLASAPSGYSQQHQQHQQAQMHRQLQQPPHHQQPMMGGGGIDVDAMGYAQQRANVGASAARRPMQPVGQQQQQQPVGQQQQLQYQRQQLQMISASYENNATSTIDPSQETTAAGQLGAAMLAAPTALIAAHVQLRDACAAAQVVLAEAKAMG
mmetsp:Transcript_104434/g.302136  ORF Transcript_104434/g.302136 Transcript_104434/m.302136 type:complete len:355 (+) Transcript_104434:311-1375(+)